jgi:hypothetical protein
MAGPKASEEQCADWVRHFTTVRFKEIETLLANSNETSRFCNPTLATGSASGHFQQNLEV